MTNPSDPLATAKLCLGAGPSPRGELGLRREELGILENQRMLAMLRPIPPILVSTLPAAPQESGT